MKKQPDITDPDERGQISTKLVWMVFSDRPWVLSVTETVQNSPEDKHGYDMYVKVTDLFGDRLKLGGNSYTLPVQIKSSDRSMKKFFNKYSKEDRFFNLSERSHQFILCGMDDPNLVLADIAAQIIVHASNNRYRIADVFDFLAEVGDYEAIIAYKKNKSYLQSRWYSKLLTPLQ